MRRVALSTSVIQRGRSGVATYVFGLLEGLAAERPEFLQRLAALVARSQVELLGGGLYEPVLASLPERDRIDQLTRMAATLERIWSTLGLPNIPPQTEVRKTWDRPYTEIIRNYDELVRAVRASEFAACLDGQEPG